MALEFKKEKNNFDEEVAAREDMWKIILGFTPMALVKCAIELGIPDILENWESPMTLAELASEIKCSQSTLYRIMRFLIHYKVFQEKPVSETSVGYAQTPLSRLLTRNVKHSMAELVLLETSPVMLAAWHNLSAWVLGNAPLPFEAAHGNDLWGFCAENPSQNKLFNDAMACDFRVAVATVIEGCPKVFEGVRTLVDVGGGDGTAIRLIVDACPWIKGINFDLPHVVDVAPACVGIEHVGGSMFDHVPKADAVYLMKILHDWPDEDCINILRKCRDAIPKDTGKVIVVDAVLEREEDHEFKGVALMLDMIMMAHTIKGKLRTSKEWSYVIGEAGFTRYTIKHIRAYQSVIEVYP
ncbi:acetylserotonin O-methyltransferase-like [Bidens hawaiensis]|uniref:acetylserotonin O-methyltransferase-like n=1 Tax=Bidens hawaiensis TaxID=980011 RepID=UPI00404A820D